jgi:hypothetical protein
MLPRRPPVRLLMLAPSFLKDVPTAPVAAFTCGMG